jgi:hypothetical protein
MEDDLRIDFKIQGVWAWAGLNWLRIGFSVRLMQIR